MIETKSFRIEVDYIARNQAGIAGEYHSSEMYRGTLGDAEFRAIQLRDQHVEQKHTGVIRIWLRGSLVQVHSIP